MSDETVKPGTQQNAALEQVDLSAFDDDYSVASANSDLPDGRYEVCILDATLRQTQKGDPMLTVEMVVLSGPHANRHLFKNSVITRLSLPVLKNELERLGLHLERLSELSSRLGELVDMTLMVTKRTKGEYSNVYFNKQNTPF